MKGGSLKRVALAVMALAGIGAVFSQTKHLSKEWEEAAKRTYVPPGQYDEFYAFLSGGFNGQLGVYAIPSGRHLRNIPVFSVNPENGYGYSEETKALLMTSHGFIPWDDTHHPDPSMTNGVPDGRWMFINANNTPRVARIDLSEFKTVEIIEIPNSAGNHPSSFVTENTEYVVAGTRFSVPIPQKDYPIAEYKKWAKGTITFIKVDNSKGEKNDRMSIAFQLLVPGFDYDLGHCGKGPSHDWCFFTSYNSEQAHTLLEINASKKDKDFILAINWKRAEQCIAQGKGKKVKTLYYHNYVDPKTGIAKAEKKTSVTMLLPKDCPGVAYYLPTPKSPHGVDVTPDGEYIVGNGKLSLNQPVHSFRKMLNAIKNKEYDGVIDGIPVLKYEAVNHCEVKNICLGPLHTEFDNKGYAYTSCFISSEVVKWDPKSCQVKDRIPVYYSIGHLSVAGGDSAKPWGKYLLALNKITKDRYLPTGPELPQSAQLIDITGEKMKMLLDFPTQGEPHYGQMLPASLIVKHQKKIYELGKNGNPYAVKSEDEAMKKGVVRKCRRGKCEVHVYLTAIRSHFTPDNIEGIKVGDTVYFHVTNIEQDWDIPHGFAVFGARNSDLLIMPGETRTLKWIPKKPGVYPFYCTDFCSALHQEMQGYVRVSPKNANVKVCWASGNKKKCAE